MIDSRKLEDLHPKVKTLAEQFISACKKAGYDVLIYCTYRDEAMQNHLYSFGRTKPGKIVTNARAGESWHNYRCAFDFVPMIGGKPQWGDKSAYAKCGTIGESLGFQWAGRWTGKLKETAHMQYTGGLTLADLRAGKTF
jgi:peptidoglycan L-alanyl-D-glutamate endopeptidase CwlK